MRVELKISSEISEPYAVIYASSVTEDVKNAISFFEKENPYITVSDNERITVLQPEDIFMVRVENDHTVVYCEKKRYKSSKRLYQLEKELGKNFMRISKSTIINLRQIYCVEPSFGMMCIVLKNGSKDCISRKYLPDFKKYLGL